MNGTPVIKRLELIPASAGAGRFRGGMGLRRNVRLLADTGRATNLGDRHVNAPHGLGGVDAAREVYKVALHQAPLAIDDRATAVLRAEAVA